MTFTDYTSVLRYDRMVLDSKSFSIEERWSIAQERSLTINSKFNPHHKEMRISWISEKTKLKCKQILLRCMN
jgi:hypothetical protein